MKINSTKGSRTIYVNDHEVSLPATFKDGFLLNDKYIVLVDDNSSKSNIFAFDIEGKKLWQIEENTYKHITMGYQRIYPFANNIIDSFCAALLETSHAVDVKTGKLIFSSGDRQKTEYYEYSTKRCRLLRFFTKK